MPYSKEFTVYSNRLKLEYPVEENADHLEMLASPSQQKDTQLVQHYLEVPLEGGYARPEVFNDEQQDGKKLFEVPPEGGFAI
ncbi:unnamed protein product [Schistocephalus solidus]|uniref:Alpha-xylosidase n=1 Tax=Schistocephalus solidus TaxID=70667 RepID=A0A183TFH5_SCHSO|nr:unnamed protein product [Schistocephalus solidus]